MAKASASTDETEFDDPVEELYFRSDTAYLCLIHNKRSKFVRVIDFRAGALPAKRLYIQSIGKKEGIEKVITLVEKDEVSSWVKVGFSREGTIPGFYKRSDGHLCGCVIGDNLPDSANEASTRLADRTINQAKKIAKDLPKKRIKGASSVEMEESEALEARDEAWVDRDHGDGELLSAFDTFGRDASRHYWQTSYKKTEPNFVSAEYQDCFSHSLIEVLRRPETEDDKRALLQTIRDVGEWLDGRGIVSGFLFVASDDVDTAAVLLAAGFRKTGLLAAAIKAEEGRKDAILWTQKYSTE